MCWVSVKLDKTRIHFDSLEHKVLWDADCPQSGTCRQRYIEVKVWTPELNLFANVCLSSVSLGQTLRAWSIRFFFVFVFLVWRLGTSYSCYCLSG